jgi:uncharacterized protein (TIGR03437 family)
MFFACTLGLLAQVPTGPVVPPHGVTNAFTVSPAPSVTAPGGIVQIQGLNLGPAEALTPTELPLPTTLGDTLGHPAVQVLVNNRPAPLVSLAATRIVIQIPYESGTGNATIVVRRGDQTSRPARITVQALAPSILAANGLGYLGAANRGDASKLMLRLTGLGITEPRVASGAVDREAKPRVTVRASVGGIPAESSVLASENRPGEFDLEVRVPPGAQPGDAILVTAGNLEANLLTTNRASRASIFDYVAYPAGFPDLRSFRSSDTNGLYLHASTARSVDGCYTTYLVNLIVGTITPNADCLTAAQAQALTPFVDAVSSAAFAAFVGPPSAPATPGQANPVSDRVRLFHPTLAEPITATLPAAATNLASAEGGNFIANVPGQPARQYLLRTLTGEVEEFTPSNPAGIANANPQQLVQRFQNLDLGDGVNRLLTNVSTLGNQMLLTAGDALDNPSRAKVAVMNPQGEVQSLRDFPNEWLPVTAPAPPQPPNAPNNPGLGALRLPTPAFLDAQTRTYYVAARTAAGKYGLAAFPLDGDARIVEFPERWTLTSCIANIPIFALELDRSVAMIAGRQEDRAFRTPCLADGFLVFDLNARSFEAVALPGAGRFNASGGTEEINDFLTGANIDPANRNTSDTLFALDGANSTAFRFDLPPGVNNFSGTARAPSLNLLIAQANNRTPGDAGIVLFDLERAEARLLPTPEGFTNTLYLGVLPSLRKLVARGIRANPAGAQILVFDLLTGDAEVVPNPEGVAWLGSPPVQATPGQPPTPGGQQVPQIPVRVNAKANTVEAIAFGEDRRQRGIAVVRVF